MQHEVWSGNRYLFTCGWEEDPMTAVEGIDHARIIRIENGVRTQVY